MSYFAGVAFLIHRCCLKITVQINVAELSAFFTCSVSLIRERSFAQFTDLVIAVTVLCLFSFG